MRVWFPRRGIVKQNQNGRAFGRADESRREVLGEKREKRPEKSTEPSESSCERGSIEIGRCSQRMYKVTCYGRGYLWKSKEDRDSSCLLSHP